MNRIIQDNALKYDIICNLQNFECTKFTVYTKKNEQYLVLKDEQFTFTLNEDLCKTAEGNSFIVLNNLHNEIVFSDMAFIWRLTVKIVQLTKTAHLNHGLEPSINFILHM
ncbi:LOW QUALITY PROTEIN: hypothetical protein MXB_226 [Myxobolus squamalis]|nr:LOW QUALITY PROTEIN: hypothetical protein MXB_226 [Myxobolus squamalis]